MVSGMVHGVRMKFIDTPGLVPSASATGRNQRILSQVRRTPFSLPSTCSGHRARTLASVDLLGFN